jgi:hypothetical protein
MNILLSALAVVATIALWHPILLLSFLAAFLLHFGTFGRGTKSAMIANFGGWAWVAFLGYVFYTFKGKDAWLLAVASLLISGGMRVPVAMLMRRLRGR